MNNLFAVTSGKGGVGKSTVATCLAAAAEQLKKKTLLIDLDEGLRCLDLMLSVSESVVLDLSDVFCGHDANSAIYPVKDHPFIYLLPAPAFYGRIDEDSFGDFIREAAEHFDLVIVDFPAGIDLRLYKKMPDTTRFITVCNPDPVSIRDAGVVSDRLGEIGKNDNRLIINRFSMDYIKSGIYKGIDDIIDASRIRLCGVVPTDNQILICQAKGKLIKRGRAAKAFLRIMKRLLIEDIPLPKPKKI
ncbi:MAG: P-loop NTPase [Acutalibacteraceae bacterium]|nr:P-loop NTPase [Acutalibacteraceae bacterium]